VELVNLQQRRGPSVEQFASVGFTVSQVGRVRDGRLSVLRLEPGGRIGRHPTVGRQVLFLVSGGATVSGDDDVEIALRPGQAVIWAPDEDHETTSAEGMVAFVIEGAIDVEDR
jgi:quercetin dioxygenase-like cupin family protein